MPDIARAKNIVLLFIAAFGLSFSHLNAQGKADKTAATIKLKDRSIFTSIKYSDVIFQLALTPGVSLEPPSSKDFDHALQLVIAQRLIQLQLHGAGMRPTEAEIRNEMQRILARFPSSDFLNRRLRIVGFESIDAYDQRWRIEERAAIEKYLNSQFLSSVVVMPEEEEDYYHNVFVPEFRRKNPDASVPGLDKQRLQIKGTLTDARVNKNVENLLRELKQNAEIVILEKSKPAIPKSQPPKKD